MRMKNITVFIEVNSKPQNRALTLIHSITVAEMFHLCLHHFLIRKLRKVNDHEKRVLGLKVYLIKCAMCKG